MKYIFNIPDDLPEVLPLHGVLCVYILHYRHFQDCSFDKTLLEYNM